MKYPFSDIYGERTRLGSRMPMTDPSQMSRDWMGQASGTYGRMQVGSKTETEAPDKTFGGALYAASSGATAGAAVGGGWGSTAAGFMIGLGAYLFS